MINLTIAEAYKIDGKKCKAIIDDMMIKYPEEIKTQSIKDRLHRMKLKFNSIRHTVPLTSVKESNPERLAAFTILFDMIRELKTQQPGRNAIFTNITE